MGGWVIDVFYLSPLWIWNAGRPAVFFLPGEFFHFFFLFSFARLLSATSPLHPTLSFSFSYSLPACQMRLRAPNLAFSCGVRATPKCCCRYPWVSPIKAVESQRPLLFLADDWLMDEGWHFNEAISTGISIRWCAAYIFYLRLIARLCHSWKFIYTMFPEGPFLPISFSLFSFFLLDSLSLSLLWCHKIMLFLWGSGSFVQCDKTKGTGRLLTAVAWGSVCGTHDS